MMITKLPTELANVKRAVDTAEEGREAVGPPPVEGRFARASRVSPSRSWTCPSHRNPSSRWPLSEYTFTI